MLVKRKQAKDDRTGQGGGEGKEAHAGFEHNGRRANGVSDVAAAARCDPRPDDLVVERGPIAVGVVETEEMDGDVALEAKEGGADAVDLLREAVMGKSGGDMIEEAVGGGAVPGGLCPSAARAASEDAELGDVGAIGIADVVHRRAVHLGGIPLNGRADGTGAADGGVDVAKSRV